MPSPPSGWTIPTWLGLPSCWASPPLTSESILSAMMIFEAHTVDSSLPKDLQKFSTMDEEEKEEKEEEEEEEKEEGGRIREN